MPGSMRAVTRMVSARGVSPPVLDAVTQRKNTRIGHVRW
jgi:hypothetical protein